MTTDSDTPNQTGQSHSSRPNSLAEYHRRRLPARISHYEVKNLLGAGGAGEVYLAQDTRINRFVAIKRLHRTNHETLEQHSLLEEAKLLAQFNHPNIVQIYDVVEQDEYSHIVMEYVPLDNLAHQIAEGSASVQQKIQWLIEITEGLSAAHKAGMIHRDLKPENILINDQHTAKITDFGVAKNAYDPNREKTTDGFIRGTFSALSPEQAQGKELNFKSDYFSLGTLAYELLTGEHPFRVEKSYFETVQNIVYRGIAWNEEMKTSVPYALLELILQLLNKKPEKRPANGQEILTILKAVQAEINQAAVDAYPLRGAFTTNATRKISPAEFFGDSEALTQTTAAHKGRKKMWGIASALFVALIAVAAGVYFSLVVDNTPTQFIAVLPPKINESQLAQDQQKLVNAAVQTAIEQTIIDANKLELVDLQGLDELDKKSIKEISLFSGADQVITSELNCESLHCDLTLKTLNGNSAAVQKNIQHSFLNNELIFASTSISNALKSAYNLTKNNHAVSHSLSDEDYQFFLTTYTKNIESRVRDPQVISKLETIIEQAPTFTPALNLYADIVLDLFYENYDDATLANLPRLLNTSASFLPNNLQLTYLKFELSLAQNNLDTTEALIQQYQQLGGHASIYHSMLGSLSYASGDYQQALQNHKISSEIRETRKSLFKLALAYWDLGKSELSIALIEKLLTSYPTDYDAKALYGSLSLQNGNLKKAIQLFEELKQKSGSPETYSNLGLSLMLSGDIKNAIGSLKVSYKAQESSAASALNYADALNIFGDKEDAEKLYKKIILLTETEDWFSLMIKAQAFMHLNNSVDAIKSLQKAQKISHDNPNVAYAGSIIYSLMGEESSAIVYAEEALKLGHSPVWFSLPWFKQLCKNQGFSNLFDEQTTEYRICKN